MANTGAAPMNAMRTPVAVAAASATGMSERGRYSKSSSSTASSTAETGLPKVAAMPAAAPAASNVLRSVGGGAQHWPSSEPERAAGGDDGPLGAEGPAGADGDRGRKGLEKGHPRRNAALVREHLLHGLGDAVAANGLGAIARHETHDDTAQHGHARSPRRRADGPRGTRSRWQSADRTQDS